MPRTPYSQGPCANCGAHRLLKYAHRTMCCRYKCQRAAAAQRQARLAGGGADDAVVPTFCYKIEAVLGMRFCDPDQLIGKKRRNKLTAADTLFATSRAVSLERMNTTRVSPTHAGWSSKSCTKTRLNSALKKQGKTEQEAADKAIVELEEGDDEA